MPGLKARARGSGLSMVSDLVIIRQVGVGNYNYI